MGNFPKCHEYSRLTKLVDASCFRERGPLRKLQETGTRAPSPLTRKSFPAWRDAACRQLACWEKNPGRENRHKAARIPLTFVRRTHVRTHIQTVPFPLPWKIAARRSIMCAVTLYYLTLTSPPGPVRAGTRKERKGKSLRAPPTQRPSPSLLRHKPSRSVAWAKKGRGRRRADRIGGDTSPRALLWVVYDT
jgi:hypothetical protein